MAKLIIYNLLKHKLVFGLIGGLVFIATFYILIGFNTLFTVNNALVKAVANNVSGELIIVPGGVKHIDMIEMNGEKKIVPFQDPDQVIAILKQNKHVIKIAPRLRVRGIVRSEKNIFPFILIGVDPSVESSLLPRRIIEKGRWLNGEHEALLYYRHADRLSVELGETLGINVQTLDGYMNFDTAKLVGELDYKDIEYYSEISFYTFISLDYLNQLILADSPIVGEILVRLDSPQNVSSVIGAVKKKFGNNYGFVLPQNSSYLVESVYNITRFLVYLIAILLLFMIYLACNLLVNLSLETRRNEIGVYMALGVSVWRIAILFGGELFFIIALFCGAGVFFGNEIITLFLGEGIEASIIPLQIIFGARVVSIESFTGTYFSIIVLMALVLCGTIASAVYKLLQCEPVELVREL